MSAPIDTPDPYAIPPLDDPPKRYTAFVSYNHDEDTDFAPALQTGLQRLAKPWNKPSSVEVFRDATSLTANPDLWASICAAMDGSEWLVLLASPQAARSVWVGREIKRWLTTKSAERIILVVTAGTWAWDEEAGDFAWDEPDQVTALHPELRGVFAREPRPVVMSWVKDTDVDLTLRNATFRDQVAEVAASLRGTTKEALVGEDVRQQRRTRRLVRSAVSALGMLTVITLLASVLATAAQQRAVASERETARERDRALSTLFAERATGYGGNRVDQRILLAAEAWSVEETPAALGALVAAAADARFTRRYVHDVGPGTTAVAVREDGSTVAALDAAGVVRLIDVETGEVRAESEPVSELVGPPVGLLVPESPTIDFLDDGEVVGVAGNAGFVALDGSNLDEVETLTIPDSASDVRLDRRGFVVYRTEGLTGEDGFVTDDTVEVLDVAAGDAESRTIPGVVGLSLTEDGRVIAVADLESYEGSTARHVGLVDVVEETTMVVDRLESVGIGRITVADVLAVSPTVTVLANLDGPAIVSDGLGELSRVEPPDGASFVSALVVGGQILLGTSDGAALLHDPLTGTTNTVGGIAGAASELATTPDGLVGVVAGDDSSLQILDLEGDRVGRPLELPAALSSCYRSCLAVTGTSAAALTEDGLVVGPLDGSDWTEIAFDAFTEPIAVALSPDASTVAVTLPDGVVELFGADGSSIGATAPASEATLGRLDWPAAFTGDGARVAAGYALVDGASADRVEDHTTDGDDAIELNGDLLPAGEIATQFNQAGDLAVTLVGSTSVDGTLQCGADCTSDLVVRDLAPEVEVDRCATAGGERGEDELDRCGQPSRVAPEEPQASVWVEVPGQASAATFDGDGRLLASVGGGAIVRYDLERPAGGAARPSPSPTRLQLRSGVIEQMATLADDALLVTAEENGVVRLHDLLQETELGTLGDDRRLLGVAPDGSQVALGGGDPAVLPIDGDALAGLLCPVAARHLDDLERETLGMASDSAACSDEPEGTDIEELAESLPLTPDRIGGARSDGVLGPEPDTGVGDRIDDAVASYLSSSPAWSGHVYLNCAGLSEFDDPDVPLPDGLACAVLVVDEVAIVVTSDGHLFLRLADTGEPAPGCEPEVLTRPIGGDLEVPCPSAWEVTDEHLATGGAPPAWAQDAAAAIPDATLLN